MVCAVSGLYVTWNDTCERYNQKMIEFQDFVDLLVTTLTIRGLIRGARYEAEYNSLMLERQDRQIVDLDIGFLYDQYLDGKTFNECFNTVVRKVVRR